MEHARETAPDPAPIAAPVNAALAPQGPDLSPASILALQRTIGNAAVGSLLERRANRTALARAPTDTTYDVDVIVPPEEERRRQQLPEVSPAAADPRTNEAYVDNRIKGIGWNIYLGGYVVVLEGLENVGGPWSDVLKLRGAVFVPESHFDYLLTNPTMDDLAVYEDRDAALSHLPMGPFAEGKRPVAYYRVRGGLIAPTSFSPATTPRIIDTAIRARREYAQAVQDELVIVALSIVTAGAVRVGLPGVTKAAANKVSPPLKPSEVAKAAAEAKLGAAGVPKPAPPSTPKPSLVDAPPPSTKPVEEAPPPSSKPAEAPVPESKPPSTPTPPSSSPREPLSSPASIEPYVNNNPRAKTHEVELGTVLDQQAQTGGLPGVKRVRGAPEVKGARSGDYRMELSDGSEFSADAYHPQTGSADNIYSNIMSKTDQADGVVVELLFGNSPTVTDQAAVETATAAVRDSQRLKRVWFVRNGKVIADVRK
jgi:hypothetical protein